MHTVDTQKQSFNEQDAIPEAYLHQPPNSAQLMHREPPLVPRKTESVRRSPSVTNAHSQRMQRVF